MSDPDSKIQIEIQDLKDIAEFHCRNKSRKSGQRIQIRCGCTAVLDFESRLFNEDTESVWFPVHSDGLSLGEEWCPNGGKLTTVSTCVCSVCENSVMVNSGNKVIELHNDCEGEGMLCACYHENDDNYCDCGECDQCLDEDL